MVQRQNVEFAADDDVVLPAGCLSRRPRPPSGHHDGPTGSPA